ncbi:olfactory receptor 11L1-like [Anomaloglossus baeobatrachus]|uniref:olfactory receptor 11L1-like n=1 Tax=Anomaloglossus baeobatrachus TaxID=238106 RepID=UPI003F4F898D
MQLKNASQVTEIFLLGFQNVQRFSVLIFPLLLMTFCLTVCGNLLIILLVFSSRSLHSPMYFFLTQLSLLDILLTTNIIPNMLPIVLYEGRSMPFIGCLIQFFLFFAVEALECLLLTVMSYDRYQAICNPLHYTTVIDIQFCLKAISFIWLIIFCMILMFAIPMGQYEYCGDNVIDHFFCDLDPILELSCSDTSLIKIESMILVIPIVLCPFTVIIVSYAYIIFTILKIPSVSGRQKTFSTCSSHLAVVCIFYGTIISMYLFPNTEDVKKIVSLLYTVVTPILNPITYSLGNRDIKQAFRKLMGKFLTALQMSWLKSQSPFFIKYR